MADVLRLIGLIYDAALQPHLWDGVLGEMTRYLTGNAAMLLAQDFVNRDGQFFHHYNDDPAYTELFFQKYGRLNPLNPHLMMAKAGDIIVASRMMPHAELRATQFYKEWVEPQNYFDFVGVTLENSGGRVANLTVGVSRDHGYVTDDQLAKFTVLAPHVRRAVAIGKVIEHQGQHDDSLAALFERLTAGIALVTAAGGIAYINPAARQLIEDDDVIRVQAGILGARDPDAHRALTEAIARAAGGDAAMVDSGNAALPLAGRSGVLYIATVMPLGSGARRQAGRDFGALAAVLIRKSAFDVRPPLEIATQRFGLSPAEVRVAYSLIEIGGVAATAKTLGLSVATIKTHMRHIFAKTGTSRQAELVKLIAALQAPG